MLCYILPPIIIFICSLSYLLVEFRFMKYINKSYFEKQPTAYESATEAIKHISSWTNWMSGLATAALAAILVILKDFKISDANSKCYAYLAALFLGSSLILSTWLMSCLPSVQQRLKKKDGDKDTPLEDNDIYFLPIFDFLKFFRLGKFSGLIHFYFIIGILFLGIFIVRAGLTTNPKVEDKCAKCCN